MQSQFTAAINQICDEKNIPKDVVLETIKAALAAAYKKDFGKKDQEVRVDLDEETGDVVAYISKEIVDEVEDPYLQISLENAMKLNKNAKIGETVEISDMPRDFGRIAAQTAKQVIIQRIREAERDIVFGEYKDKEGEVINGTIQRIEGNNIIIDLGKASAILFPNEQISSERYYMGQRMKFYVVRVEQNAKGPQIVVSRSHPGLVKRLFELEVPEILAGIVEIKAIAREAGQRTKMAVFGTQEGVDPVGSCVGQRGVRVQAVMNEIGEEKIDIILWDEDAKTFISNALSPAKISSIELNEEEKKAKVTVPEDQLSLAIGKSGQNVRLAAKLTGWNVDIAGGDESGVEKADNILRPVADKRDLEAEILKAVESSSEEVPEENPAESTEVVEEPSTEEVAEGNEEPKVEDEAPVANETEVAEQPTEETQTETKTETEVEPVAETAEPTESEQTGEDQLAEEIATEDDSAAEVEPTLNTTEAVEAEGEPQPEIADQPVDDGIDDVAQILEEEKGNTASK